VGPGEEGHGALTPRRSTAAGQPPRLAGPSTIFGKALRDSRGAIALAIVFLAFVMLVGAAAIASAFGTVETRQQMSGLATTLPSIFQSMLGPPVALDTLGGLIAWRYQIVLAVLMPVWSILALSGTLAGEADRGSLELLATTGITRRRLALEKLAAHLVAVFIAMVALAVVVWLCGAAFATLPGDEIAPGAAIGYAALTAVLILAPGAVAFAAAPFLGRGAAAGLAAFVMVGGYLVNGFHDSIDLFETLRPLSWYSWTANHIPLAGRYDWLPLAGLAVLAAGLLLVGVLAFERRDVGRTIRLPAPRLPGFLLGLRGPIGRTFGERLRSAGVWGVAIGLYVLLVASTASSLADMFHQVPALEQMMRFLYPDIDYTSVGGVLQLVFLQFGLIVFGFTAATAVAGWASEESSGRLEVLLSAPMTRAAWFVRSGLGTFLAIALSAAIVSLATVIGAAGQGSDAGQPARGAWVLALYGLAWAGVGLAVGGLVRSSLAAPTVIALTVGSFLIELFATALRLPDWVAGLALASHYGRPLVGNWDPVGIVASLVLAIGGLAVGAWGMTRRDVRG
jgi:ABC-2 type transport system permease protein